MQPSDHGSHRRQPPQSGAAGELNMELLTTHGLPRVGRAAAWGEIYATRMSQCEFTPGDQDDFDAELRIGQLGPVKLARLSLDRCSVERKQSHIKPNAPLFFFKQKTAYEVFT